MIELKHLDKSWIPFFEENNKNLEKINHFLIEDKEKFKQLEIYPEKRNVFRIFELLKPEEIKVIIIGQDCYHGPGQATGIAFGINEGIKTPPSLRNIEKELGKKINNYNLENWVKQGVFLLNTSLTVRQSCAGSHLKMWKPWTQNMLKLILEKNEKIIIVLWGKFAKNLYRSLNLNMPYVLEASHPSPLSANRGGWFGNGHFQTINDILSKENKDMIDW